MRRFLWFLVLLAAFVLPSAARAQTANYPNSLYTYTAPSGACTPPTVTTGCRTGAMFDQVAKEVQAIEAELDVLLAGLNNRSYTLISTTDRFSVGTGISLSAPATAALRLRGPFTADPSSLGDGDLWIRNGGVLKFRAGGVTYSLVSAPSTFLGLSDAPGGGTGSYTGHQLQLVRVNSGETGLEFVPTQSANVVFAGPTTGAAATPAFRALVDADIPSAIARDSEINVQGTANEISSSGSGVAPTVSIASTFRLGGKSHTAPTTIGTTPPATCAIGDLHFDSDATSGQNVYGCTATDTWTLEGGAGGGGDITDVGDCATGACFQSVTTNKVLASPNGSTGVATMRALVAADIPSLDTSKLTTGLLGVSRGGTGVDASAAANGNLLIGNGSGFTLAGLTAGANITITPGAGSITIAASGSTGYGTVKDETTALTQRATLAFLGAGVTCADNAGSTQTECTIPGGSSSPHALLDGSQDNDTAAHTPVLGDLIYANSTPAWTALAGNTTTTPKYARQVGNGSVSAAPTWSQPAFSELSGSATCSQLPALTGDATTSAGSCATTLASVVTAGSCGDATHSCGLTYDAKGRITAATNNAISGGGGGNPVWNVLTKTASYTIVSGDITGKGALIICSTGSGSVPLTLPAASAIAGGTVAVKRNGANACTVTAAGSDTMYDTYSVTSKTLTSDGQFFEFVADGTSQWILK